MLDVDMDKAEVILPERTLALGSAFGEGLWPAVQAFCFENAPDTVAMAPSTWRLAGL